MQHQHEKGAQHRQAPAPCRTRGASSLMDCDPEREVRILLGIIALLPLPWLMQSIGYVTGWF